MKIRWLTLAAVVLAGASLTSSADDWPQWRGPNRNGVSEETGLLQKWPADGPKLLWQVKDLGGGYSTPAVVGDRIYLVNDKGNDNESVQALSTADGSVVYFLSDGNPTSGGTEPNNQITPELKTAWENFIESNGIDKAFAIGVGNGVTLPSANAGMVSVQPHLAGSASGLGGAMTIGGGAALSVLASSVLSREDGTWPLLLVMLATGLVALLTTYVVRLQEKRE